jgi:phage tail sheath protein FI
MYVEEASGEIRTIGGVPTSIAAFLGRARRGPIDEPTDVFGLEEFVQIFGEPWTESWLGDAVRDFLANGGRHAIVVRLQRGAGRARLEVGGLELEAASEGSWGADLRAEVDHRDLDRELSARLGVDLFNLSVREAVPGGRSERFTDLSASDDERSVVAILARESRLVRARPGGAVTVPADGSVDRLSSLEAEVRATRRSPEDRVTLAAREARARLRAALARARRRASDGDELTAESFIGGDAEAERRGLYSLDEAPDVNLLCIPPHSTAEDAPGAHLEPALLAAAAAYCERRRAMLIVDPWPTWERGEADPRTWLEDLGTDSPNAAVYFPRLRRRDLQGNPAAGQASPPSGAIAGVIARTDTARGVWRAPAGTRAGFAPGLEPAIALAEGRLGDLAALGVNCLRVLPDATAVVWGARTLQGADDRASQWKYMPVRRLALFIEESLHRGLAWVVFESNDESLWAQVRRSVGAFLDDLFRQGALIGSTPDEAHFERCDRTTMTQSDIDDGRLNVLVGFAPVKPAEFLILHIQHLTARNGGGPP